MTREHPIEMRKQKRLYGEIWKSNIGIAFKRSQTSVKQAWEVCQTRS